MWFTASVMICVTAYATGSAEVLAFATSSMVLSMLSLGGLVGIKALAYAQMPFTNVANTVLAFRRLTRMEF
jgi:hypothetical protein